MALVQDRATPMRHSDLIAVPVSAGVICYAGGLAVANTDGYAEPGTTANNLTYLGRFEEQANNSGGGDGDKTVVIRRRKAFLFGNHAGDLIDPSSLGKPCYIVDDETVAKGNGGGSRSPAGIVVGVEDNGVWVE